MKEYKIVNGTSYNPVTDPLVIDVLEQVRQNRHRVQLVYGNTETGEDWYEEHDVRGYIGRSTGLNKIPIVVHNARCLGGTPTLEHCILRIRFASIHSPWLYQHSKYHHGEIEIAGNEVLIDGKVHARFDNEVKAKNWCRLMGFNNLGKIKGWWK